MPSPLPFHDEPAVRAFLDALPGGRAAYPVLRRALYRDHLAWAAALALVAPSIAGPLAARFAWTTLVARATDQAPDGSALKTLWEAPDGARVESVLMGHRAGRTTLCLSSQVGCALGCAFCATGRLGLVRELTTAEILEQATAAVRTLAARGERLRNIVFMGMGEPLWALDTVGPALEALVDQRRFEIAPRYLSISTCGIPAGIDEFARRFPRIKVAVSLHAARQELRDRLMPGCRAWPLDELMAALDRYALTTGHRLFFEHILIAGVNDGDGDAADLAALLAGRDAHVNLIPYNPVEGDPWGPSDRGVQDRFQGVLRGAGVVSTVRHSAGGAIAAACGQLAGRESGGKAPSGKS